MKKMMFALAIALVAGVSFGSAVNWQFTGSSTQVGLDVFAMSVLPKEIASLSDIKSDSTAKVDKQGRIYGADGTLDGLSVDAGKTVDFYLVLTGSKDGDDYYYAIAQSGTAYDPNSTDMPILAKYDGTKISAIGGEGWTKISGATPPGPGGDVPEPTSGLLLALGGAALALRRKQK